MAKSITLSKSLTQDYRLTDDTDDDNVAEILNKSQQVKKYIENEGVKRGDIIIVDTLAGYRDDGKFIYDGTKILPLYGDGIDDYGMKFYEPYS